MSKGQTNKQVKLIKTPTHHYPENEKIFQV